MHLNGVTLPGAIVIDNGFFLAGRPPNAKKLAGADAMEHAGASCEKACTEGSLPPRFCLPSRPRARKGASFLVLLLPSLDLPLPFPDLSLTGQAVGV